MSLLKDLHDHLPTADMFTHAGLDCTVVELKHWFFTATIVERPPHLMGFLNLNLQFSKDEFFCYRQAEAMGLLGFHFYHPIALTVPVPAGCLVSAWTEPKLGTPILLQCKDSNEMKTILNWLQSNTTSIMVTALEALRDLCSRYDLKPTGESI
ncbi:MAG: hypothetical protein H3C47_11125 [Candidatus Cloacimonetes bacterium]|nr:hypothetical protein [Candidatus Cloacimonadota bacterium]